MAFTLAVFAIDDYDEVRALWQQCEGVGLDTQADSREDVRPYLERNPGMSYVARQGGELVGAILCGHDGRRGYLHHLAVRPDKRRQGIGHALVEKCLTALASIGIGKCHLFIFQDNAQGIAFWQRLGWTVRSDLHVVSKNLTTRSF